MDLSETMPVIRDAVRSTLAKDGVTLLPTGCGLLAPYESVAVAVMRALHDAGLDVVKARVQSGETAEQAAPRWNPTGGRFRGDGA